MDTAIAWCTATTAAATGTKALTKRSIADLLREDMSDIKRRCKL